MKILRNEAATAADLKAIENLEPILAQLSEAGPRRLLAIVARKCLEETQWTEIPLFNEDQRPFAYVMALPRPEDEFYSELTPAMMAEIKRRALTPEDSIPWHEMLAELEREESRGLVTAQCPGPSSPRVGK